MTPQAVQAERHPQARTGFQGPRRAAWEARASDPNLAAWHLLPPTRVGVGGWSQALGEGNPERAQQTPVSATEAPQTLPEPLGPSPTCQGLVGVQRETGCQRGWRPRLFLAWAGMQSQARLIMARGQKQELQLCSGAGRLPLQAWSPPRGARCIL